MKERTGSLETADTHLTERPWSRWDLKTPVPWLTRVSNGKTAPEGKGRESWRQWRVRGHVETRQLNICEDEPYRGCVINKIGP